MKQKELVLMRKHNLFGVSFFIIFSLIIFSVCSKPILFSNGPSLPKEKIGILRFNLSPFTSFLKKIEINGENIIKYLKKGSHIDYNYQHIEIHLIPGDYNLSIYLQRSVDSEYVTSAVLGGDRAIILASFPVESGHIYKIDLDEHAQQRVQGNIVKKKYIPYIMDVTNGKRIGEASITY